MRLWARSSCSASWLDDRLSFRHARESSRRARFTRATSIDSAGVALGALAAGVFCGAEPPPPQPAIASVTSASGTVRRPSKAFTRTQGICRGPDRYSRPFVHAKGPTSEDSDARWVSTARERPRWDERNRMIAAYVPLGSAVVDIGAGAQSLREHLPPGCDYQPCDIVPGEGVLPCDIDNGQWPDLGRKYEIAVCSGVLEHMTDIEPVLRGLPSVARRALVTYCDRGRGQRIATRVAQGWQNHLTLPELRRILDRLDGDWRFLTEWRHHVIVAIDFEPGLPPLRAGDMF